MGNAPGYPCTYTPAYNTLKGIVPILNQLSIFPEKIFLITKNVFKWNQSHKEQIKEQIGYIAYGNKLWI